MISSIANAQEFSVDGDLRVQGNLIFSDSTSQSTAYTEDVALPFEIAFVTGVGHGIENSSYLYLYILTKDDEFFEYSLNDNDWIQRNSPPVSSTDIVFMEGVGHGVGMNARFIFLLSKNNDFYFYNGSSDLWFLRQSPPVAP